MVLERIGCDFSICRLKSLSKNVLESEFVFAAKTDQEYSLVCLSTHVPADALEREDGWKAFRIQGTLDFSLTGILAPIAQLLAAHEIGIFAVSTYKTDYVLIKNGQYETALSLLEDSGYDIM